MSSTFLYGEGKLTVSIALDLVNGTKKGVLSERTKEIIARGEHCVNKIVENGSTVYGINTGFGILANTKISKEDTKILQEKILQSHSVGVGNKVPPQVAKLMLISKVHALAKGYSGVQLSTLERIIWHIDNNYIPVVPEKGSVGASGDLAPLAHLFLPLIGLGGVQCKTQNDSWHEVSVQSIFNQCQLSSLQLGPKEGLALINGTQFILAFATIGVDRFFKCLELADWVGAMSLEALMGSASPFDARLHELRPFEGCQLVAQRLKKLLQGSAILDSHSNCDRVQDPYSLRCMPQVHGASRNAWLHLKELVEIELNAVTDNPIVFNENETISGGNFHGQPLALPLDYACFAAAELGNISDRRTFLLLEGKWGLPTLLMEKVGLDSGFMIPQYTTAALVTENKTLCFPASADSVPTSLGQEDHVSMGSISGRKFNQVIDNLEYILSIEMLLAAQALEFRRPLKSSSLIEHMHALIRSKIEFAKEDRVFALDIEQAVTLFRDPVFFQNCCQQSKLNGVELNQGFTSFTRY
ncbi:MAG: histidine ammonia-lyase [Bacteroidetes bacterium]|nr:histidine ammonia-lyase [Bacteroidota bacterium]